VVPFFSGESNQPILADLNLNSIQDPYFPHGVVDLRYAIACEPHGEKGFRIRTNQKTVNLEADSIPSRDEWVKSIKKVIFQAQNLGDSVKVNTRCGPFATDAHPVYR
jgi:hypothetical protein